MNHQKINFKNTKGITLIALVITIIVLLILAGVTISALSGDNGILTNATKAKEQTEISNEKDAVSLAVGGALAEDEGNIITYDNLVKEFDQNPGSGKYTLDGTGPFTVTFTDSGRAYLIDENGKISEIETGPVEQPEETPELWEATRTTDSAWYSYVDVTSNTVVKVNSPKLTGGMKPIKYVGPKSDTQTGSKWANAMTSDGSMFVWIPRYAYKITSGYHSDTAGTIEIAFIDTNNRFLNSSDSGEITENPLEEGAGQTKWLVHPAFTNKPENGGWDSELSGIWVGKFETTGDINNLSVKPGVTSVRNQTSNAMYLAGKSATFGEASSESIGSHMIKNSEWGAVAYLSHSKYGVNGAIVNRNTSSSFITGESSTIETIYRDNKDQSTTGNCYGIYDMVGGAWERVASYVNYANNSNLQTNGGTNAGDLYGANEEEQKTSTKYKTVYEADGTSQANSYNNKAILMKGDAVYETSGSYSSSTGSWLGAHSYFPYTSYPFFLRGGGYSGSGSGVFYFNYPDGNTSDSNSFRVSLVV